MIADKSVDSTVNVPPAPLTEMDLAPLGSKDTVLVPALTVPEKATSLAVMKIAEFVEEIDVEPALVTLPVPSVLIVTPRVPVALALSAMAPFEPSDVCKVSELPDSALLAVILPLATSVKEPVLDVIAPEVPMLPVAPIVVTEKLPLTVEAARVTASDSLKNAAPEVEALSVVALVSILVMSVPKMPEVEINEAVPVLMSPAV